MQAIIRALLVAALLSLGLTLPAPAAAAPITYFGADLFVGQTGHRPNADAAAASFDAATVGFDLITFEELPAGDFSTLEVFPGVTITLTNTAADANAGVSNVDAHVPEGWGYNTTAAGENHLRVVPNFLSPLGGIVTFSFATPIDAFGTYLTDTDAFLPCPMTLTFFDGRHRVLSVPKTLAAGVSFFGFTDFGTEISQVSLHTGPTTQLRDIWGMDDVRFRSAAVAVPELATILLLGVGLLGVAFAVRRHGRRP